MGPERRPTNVYNYRDILGEDVPIGVEESFGKFFEVPVGTMLKHEHRGPYGPKGVQYPNTPYMWFTLSDGDNYWGDEAIPTYIYRVNVPLKLYAPGAFTRMRDTIVSESLDLGLFKSRDEVEQFYKFNDISDPYFYHEVPTFADDYLTAGLLSAAVPGINGFIKSDEIILPSCMYYRLQLVETKNVPEYTEKERSEAVKYYTHNSYYKPTELQLSAFRELPIYRSIRQEVSRYARPVLYDVGQLGQVISILNEEV